MIAKTVWTTNIIKANFCDNCNSIFVVTAVAGRKALFSSGAKHTIAVNVNERDLHISLGE